jgi:hypothetical protein
VAKPKTPGEELEGQLTQAIHQAQQAPAPGARQLPVLQSLSPKGGFTVPQDNVLLQTAGYLAASGRVYVYGDSIMLEMEGLEGQGRRLAPLRRGARVEVGAEDLLANLFCCQAEDAQFPVPKWFTDVLLRCELLPPLLPRVRHYAKRSVFDEQFVLLGPGWHPGAGVLVHGPEVEPAVLEDVEPDGPAVERLPPHLRALLQGFCFRSDADVANAVAMLLTGLLLKHFAEVLKPIFLVDGNQPGLGKTLLVRVVGMVLDGVDPRLIHYTANDEELQKQMCATLREERQSILLIDNAKVNGGEVKSPAIEANSMAPEVSLRILGKSENYNRPNDLLWALTMNLTRVCPDLVTRGAPIRLEYEGKPEDRTFDGPDPIAYAREHRLDILGELAGMVVRWDQAGRPPGGQTHRLHDWAALLGGILETAGLPEFLANADEAAATFNTVLDELAALAEAVIEAGGPFVEGGDGDEE